MPALLPPPARHSGCCIAQLMRKQRSGFGILYDKGLPACSYSGAQSFPQDYLLGPSNVETLEAQGERPLAGKS